MSEQTERLRSQVDRGTTARIVLAELDKAFKALEEDCFKVFRSSDIHDEVGQRTCRLYLRVLDDVKTRFTNAVRTGEAAHKELQRLKDPNPLRKIVGI